MTDPATLSMALGVLNIVALVVAWLSMARGATARFARIDLKVETMWDILVRDALSDAQKQGLIRRKSPMTLSSEIARNFRSLAPRLRDFYLKNRLEKISENELILLIARNFAADLLEQVCAPANVNLRMALLAAIHLIKERPVEEDEDAEKRE